MKAEGMNVRDGFTAVATKFQTLFVIGLGIKKNTDISLKLQFGLFRF